MAYYKVRIEVWCDWNPAESDLEEIAESMGVGEAICTRRGGLTIWDSHSYCVLRQLLGDLCCFDCNILQALSQSSTKRIICT